MNDSLVRVYHTMPPLGRTLLASIHGYQLRHSRYGRDTARLVKEALARECWSGAAWHAWQKEQLARVLHRAAERVPYYREHWAARRRAGDRSPVECLENWPILEKEELRRHARAFVADDFHERNLVHETTSGTTGQPVHLWFSPDAVRAWYALAEARWRHWYGLSRRQRWALIGGQLVTPVDQHKPPYWVWNIALRQLYMSAYHLSPEALGYYLDAIVRYRVAYLWGHSSALEALAREVIRTGRKDIHIRAAISSSEPLGDGQRRRIGTAFGCPVRETYGMAEMAAAASECEHGRLHLWPEAGWYEAVPAGDGGPAGHLLSTAFLNRAMPLVRYRVGDIVTLAERGSECPCGRSLPVLLAVEGRTSDIFRRADGSRITPAAVEMIFETDMPLAEAQIIQESFTLFRIRYVPAAGFTPATRRTLCDRVRERMGDVEVAFEEVARIPRAANGKFQAAVSRIAADAAEV
ncbi:MAG: hypothetical protein M1436_10450 [Acidobacteria bacterium]|nr:hypothetical protein [Acidobacteriota bacterium]